MLVGNGDFFFIASTLVFINMKQHKPEVKPRKYT
jgi:hypothetical protein